MDNPKIKIYPCFQQLLWCNYGSVMVLRLLENDDGSLRVLSLGVEGIESTER